MDFIGRMISAFFDLLVLPFGKTNPMLGLVALSILTGVGMAVVFKFTSNASAIRTAKDRLKARILEMRIYQDDPALILKAFGGTLRSNAVYLGKLLKPILVLIIPVVIIFMQLDERYSRSPLSEGARTNLSVELRDGHDPFTTPVDLTIVGGVIVDSKPVRVRDTREVDWRLRVDWPGTYDATLTAGEATYTIPIVAENAYRMIGHERRASSFIEPLLHPAFPAIPAESPFERVRVDYPSAAYPFLFWNVHWLVIFIIYSFLAAIALKFVIKFEI